MLQPIGVISCTKVVKRSSIDEIKNNIILTNFHQYKCGGESINKNNYFDQQRRAYPVHNQRCPVGEDLYFCFCLQGETEIELSQNQ